MASWQGFSGWLVVQHWIICVYNSCHVMCSVSQQLDLMHTADMFKFCHATSTTKLFTVGFCQHPIRLELTYFQINKAGFSLWPDSMHTFYNFCESEAHWTDLDYSNVLVLMFKIHACNDQNVTAPIYIKYDFGIIGGTRWRRLQKTVL